MIVAPSKGMAGPLAASMAAFLRSMPFLIRTAIPSDTTIALSTIMPMAIINAPSDMRCKSIPIMAMGMNVARMVRTRAVPMIIPIRRPDGITSTARTMATASAKLIIKPLMDSLTSSDCQAMRVSSIPTGSVGINSSNLFSILLPVSTTFPPETLANWIAMAGLPSRRMSSRGGSR